MTAATTIATTSFAGLLGTVLAYATPEIQRRQIWPRESYWVRLDCDAPDGAGRLFD